MDRFIRSNFDEFVTTTAFLELSQVELCAYLKHKNLKMKDEETVLKSALRWCKHNQTEDEFKNLAQYIQFDLISVRTLCAILKDDDVFKNCRITTNMIEKSGIYTISMEIAHMTLADQGMYKVVVKNRYGMVSSTITVSGSMLHLRGMEIVLINLGYFSSFK